MTELTRPYRGVSASDRKAGRRERLLAAALNVVGRDGVAATTVGAVCDEAGLTKRYFYESFRDLDTLLEELLEDFHVSLLGTIKAALPEVHDGPRARATLTVSLLLSAMDDPGVARLYVEAAAHTRLQAKRQDAYEVYADLVLTDVLGLTEVSEADRVRALAFVAGTTQVVIDWLQERIDVRRETLIDELAAVSVRR